MPSKSNVLEEWKGRLSRSHRAHKRAAAHYETWGRRLGVIATVSSAIVGTTIFATLQETPHIAIKISAGLLSIAAAVFAALQTYFNFPERAQNQSKAAIGFGDLRRRVERLEANPPTVDQLDIALASLDEEWKAFNERVPIIEQKFYDEMAHPSPQQGVGEDAPKAARLST